MTVVPIILNFLWVLPRTSPVEGLRRFRVLSSDRGIPGSRFGATRFGAYGFRLMRRGLHVQSGQCMQRVVTSADAREALYFYGRLYMLVPEQPWSHDRCHA